MLAVKIAVKSSFLYHFISDNNINNKDKNMVNMINRNTNEIESSE